MRPALRFSSVLLFFLTTALVVCAWFSFRQQSLYQPPEDGVTWVDTPQGVTAWIVTPNGPGARAGIREGDTLKSINGVPIRRAREVIEQIWASGVWSQATYDLYRQGEEIETSLVLTPQTQYRPIHAYLELLGVFYLLIGAYVLVRRWGAPKAVHFYAFCLASFALYTLHYTGKLNLFDSAVYWLNVLATLLQPTLFLHFCLTFSDPPAILRRRYAAPLLYAPVLLLGGFHVIALSGMLQPEIGARWLADRAEYFYLAGCFVGGAAVLARAYRRTRVPLLKQQLKWLTRGTFLAIGPFALLYALPYALGFVPRPWMNVSVLSLVFLPLTFGYAILHYRLMDVDIIFRRGIAYTLATATIVAAYFVLIALLGDWVRTTFPLSGRSGWLLVIIVTAILFQPWVNWIQARLDRFFNPEKYDYRRTLLEFARELTSELHVDRLVDQVTERLAETLRVERAAVFLASEDGTFHLAKARGLGMLGTLDLSFLDPARPELGKGYLFFDSVRRAYGVSPAAAATIERLDLHYYLPFQVKGRTLGYLALGKTREGDFLSSEDVDLLRTVTGYVSIALESARLYESLEQKALQNEALKEFSESIIESINAGVLAANLEGRIESWNSAMERLYGVERCAAVGKRLEEIFPQELLAELEKARDARQAFSLYKFRLRTPDDRQLVVNLSFAPLVGRDGRVMGRLLILNDLTERVNLEDQLAQAEKLSSIGLLAAGVAHEVNTPLAVIASQAQMLLKQLPPDGAPARTLEKIIKQAFRASDIVNSLLKFSRVTGSEYTELDLNKLIQETLSLAEPMLKSSKISLNLQLSPGLPPVYGNYGKLQQVFMNLIMNARDAMHQGGELTLATECEDSVIRAEVCDNGVGIPADHLNKIFDPFFTTKASSRGTGLGLAVSYGIIREHAGEIRVESRVGQGTTFRLEFPAARKPVHVV
jgi:two-component system NtrC family sensor kinase